MSICYSLALRICSDNDKFKHRTEEVTKYPSNRGYKHKFITTKINKVSQIPGHIALQDTTQHRNDRVPFVVTYNPGLTQIPFINILHKYFPFLQSSSRFSKIFAKPPMTA